MTKVYELPDNHRMIVDIDETTRTCTITETQLDSLISKLNYYAEQTEVLDKIRDEIETEMNDLYRQKSIDQRTLTIIHACQRHIAIIDECTKGEGE